MKRSRLDPFEAAKVYAFLLLKFRLRSEKELEMRLKKKKITEEAIKRTITFLKEKRFIDDALFAKGWIESRLRNKQGLRKIKQELKIKGIDKSIIEEKIGDLKGSYSESDTVREIARERLEKLKNIDSVAARRRVYAYLMRRGFSPEIVVDAINSLCEQTF